MLDMDFLADCGLAELDDDAKLSLLRQLASELEVRVGERLSEGLSVVLMDEFGKLAEHDESAVSAWLRENRRDYLTDPRYRALRDAASDDASPLDIAAEYAGMEWLSLHRPDHRDVVMAELARLRVELTEFAQRVVV